MAEVIAKSSPIKQTSETDQSAIKPILIEPPTIEDQYYYSSLIQKQCFLNNPLIQQHIQRSLIKLKNFQYKNQATSLLHKDAIHKIPIPIRITFKANKYKKASDHKSSPSKKQTQDHLSIKIRKLSPKLAQRLNRGDIQQQMIMRQQLSKGMLKQQSIKIAGSQARYQNYSLNKKQQKMHFTQYKNMVPFQQRKYSNSIQKQLIMMREFQQNNRLKMLSPLKKGPASLIYNDQTQEQSSTPKPINFLNIQGLKPIQRKQYHVYKRPTIPDSNPYLIGRLESRQKVSVQNTGKQMSASSTNNITSNKQFRDQVTSPKKKIPRTIKPFVPPFQKYYYRDFLWKLNYAHSLTVQILDQYPKSLKVYIGPGNNKMLVKGLLKRRNWWTISQSMTSDCNFVWTQIKVNDIFKNQKKNELKHNFDELNIQNSKQLLDKQKIKQKSKEKEEQQKANSQGTCLYSPNNTSSKIHSAVHAPNSPIKVNKELQKSTTGFGSQSTAFLEIHDHNQKIIKQRQILLWRKYFAMHRNAELKLKENMQYRNKYLRKVHSQKIISNTLKIHNHLENNYVIGNKKALFYTMSKFYQLTKQNIFQYLPITFHIQSGLEDPTYLKFLNVFYQRAKLLKKQQKQEGSATKKLRNIWIVKPGQFTNRGTGITVCLTLDQIKSLLKTKQKHANGNPKTYIVQSYLDRPFLYYRRKFDIRHYMMITSINGIIRGYWYEEGYLRTTSFQYTIKTNSTGIHLTNDAIQKYLPQYGKYQKGNKLSYVDFQKYLQKQYVQKYNFFNDVYPKMKKIATDAIKASFLNIDKQKREHNFQIFGMDFMIDQNFNPWLIQINTNPCLQLSCPLLGKLIPSMVQNALRIGLDPLFPPPINLVQKNNYFGQNALQTNRFHLVFDSNVQGEQISRLYKTGNYTCQKDIDNISSDNEVYQDDGNEWDGV